MSVTVPPKLVVKGGTGLSLHERFSRLSSNPPVANAAPAAAAAPQQQRPLFAGRSTGYAPTGYVASGNFSRPDAFPPPDPFSGRGVFSSRGNFSGGGPGAFAPLRRPFSARGSGDREDKRGLFRAALKIKQRAIVHRLGPHERLGFSYGFQTRPYYRGGARRFYGRRRYGGGFFRGATDFARGYGRGGSPGGGISRWNSTASLASDGTGQHLGRRGRGSFYPRKSFYNRGHNFRGRGGGRGQGRGRGRGGQTPVSKEELDEQLDAYMQDSRSALDKDLDVYMSNK